MQRGLRLCAPVASLAVTASLLAIPDIAYSGSRVLRELVTPTFRVVSAIDEKKTRRVAADIAAFEEVILRSSAAAPDGGELRTNVYFVSSEDWAHYFAPGSNVGGFFSPGWPNSIVIPGWATYEAYPVVFHEYSHYLLHSRATIAWPPWFDEGLAELMSNAHFNPTRLSFTAPKTRMQTLNTLPWLPLEKMLTVERASPDFQRHRLVASFYAQSWLMMHYAFVGRPEVLRQAVDFVLQRNRGEALAPAVQASFGKSVKDLDADLFAYSRRRQFRDAEVAIAPNRAILETPMRELTNGAAEIELAALALRLGRSAASVEKLLNAALDERPDEPWTLAAMAYLRASEKNDVAAQDYRARLESGQTKFDTRTSVLLGDSYLEQADRDHQSGLAISSERRELYGKARGWYDAALAASPDDLESIHSYTLPALRLHENLDIAQRQLERGVKLAPRDVALAVDLARVYEARGDTAAAAPYLQMVARRTLSQELKQWALDRLAGPSGTSSGKTASESGEDPPAE